MLWIWVVAARRDKVEYIAVITRFSCGVGSQDEGVCLQEQSYEPSIGACLRHIDFRITVDDRKTRSKEVSLFGRAGGEDSKIVLTDST